MFQRSRKGYVEQQIEKLGEVLAFILTARHSGRYDAALAQADPADRIVVFGSFYTVGGVLKDGPPRLVARHLG